MDLFYTTQIFYIQFSLRMKNRKWFNLIFTKQELLLAEVSVIIITTDYFSAFKSRTFTPPGKLKLHKIQMQLK